MPLPLSGIRVLDLTNVLAGPFCCHQLAHLGAEVVKVEAPGRGDLARQLGADPELNARGMGVSYLAQNAGKKSVTLNLKHPEGKDLFFRLLGTADVLVENFRPGVMARLGLDYAQLKPRRPSLIYCAISGFGQTGPWVERPAYDQIIQGASGLMSVTGDMASAPLSAGFPVADTVGGLTAAFAISASLNANPRGTFIDVAMLASLLSTMGWVVSNHLIAGADPAPNGNENPTSAPSGTFMTQDGPINIAANKDTQWIQLTEVLGLGHLRDLDAFRSCEDRKANRSSLRSEIEAVLKRKPASHWVERLNAVGVPAGPILSVPEILSEAQITGRGFLSRFPNVPGVGRDIQVATTGVMLDGTPPSVATAPPELGADNAEIWGDLGLDAGDIERLKEDGAI